MKKIVSSVSVVALLLVCLLSLAGCQAATTTPAETEPLNPEEGLTGVWVDATYTADTTLGNGAKTMSVVVSAEGKAITLTVKTDKETVGAALSELNLIQGADGMYTVVNGMTADWNVDKTYWAFYENDAYANQGLDDTAIADGVTYKLERTAG